MTPSYDAWLIHVTHRFNSDDPEWSLCVYSCDMNMSCHMTYSDLYSDETHEDHSGPEIVIIDWYSDDYFGSHLFGDGLQLCCWSSSAMGWLRLVGSLKL